VSRDPGVGTFVLRSLPLQAAFNPVNLQGAGFAYALLPALRRVHGSRTGPRAAALSENFNANPYLATFGIGAVAAAEGSEPAERVDRFVQLVRAPLGALGDALFWGAARPAIFVSAALAVLGGAPWWWTVPALVVFNVLAFAARITGARAGLAHGLEVAACLARSWVRRAPELVRPVGALLIGSCAGWLLFRSLAPGPVAPAASGGVAGPGAFAGGEPISGWLVIPLFALAVPLFVFWPRRVGWGAALLCSWAVAAAIVR
jgi:mannose/fructose/N-acetylgalactosamine-specific phosphotransferase system component IID